MPYNTRRKSLSLPSLGIQLPNASRAHRQSISKTSPPQSSPPSKKIKRSHQSTSPAPSSPSPSRPRAPSISKNVSFVDRPKTGGRLAYEQTPPPSPGPLTHAKIDTQGINDEIVVGVIEQLEKTGNRPHLIRELATVLSSTSHAVSSSANPGALLSSRLSSYMKRTGWSALSPCPLDKELTTVHPRKVYFYLTTRPRQEIPADSSDILDASAPAKGGKRIISPSLSNASVDGDAEAAEERKREALSPSPEVDLSMHEIVGGPADADAHFTAPGVPGPSSFSTRYHPARDGSHPSRSDNALTHSHRATSPPLEGDEKEFTQTASIVRMRGVSLDDHRMRSSTEDAGNMLVDETEEERAWENSEAAESLFGSHDSASTTAVITSSPLVKPSHPHGFRQDTKPRDRDVQMQEPTSILGNQPGGLSWETREPEDIQIEDLDDLFMAY